MVIRNKYNWVFLPNIAFYSAIAIFVSAFKSDKFMVPFYLFIVALSAIAWSSIYTTLSEGVLTKHVFFIALRSFPVGEIMRIAPHEKNGKWSYGTVITVFSNNGQRLTLQPNHPEPFLALLHQQAPQAEYLF
jgi:hypothetical protein